MALPSVRRSSVGHFEEWNGCDITKEGRLPFLSWLTKACFFFNSSGAKEAQTFSLIFSLFRHLTRTSDFGKLWTPIMNFSQLLVFPPLAYFFLGFLYNRELVQQLDKKPKSTSKEVLLSMAEAAARYISKQIETSKRDCTWKRSHRFLSNSSLVLLSSLDQRRLQREKECQTHSAICARKIATKSFFFQHCEKTIFWCSESIFLFSLYFWII